MKYIFIINILFYSTFGFSQSLPLNSSPTSQTNSKKNSSSSTQNLVLNLMRDTCLDKKFSVIFYLINDSNYKLTAPSTSFLAIQDYNLPGIIYNLNNTFKPICVEFEHCRTVIIPDFEANNWKASGFYTADILKTYYEKNVINIYLPDGVNVPLPIPDGDEKGYTFPFPPMPLGTFQPVDAIICTGGAYSLGGGLMHLIGHYFGLPHTYDEKNPLSIPNPPPPNNASPPISTLEYVDHASIQNCLDHGDGFCDTEADIYPSVPTPTVYPRGQISNCTDAGGLKDGHGDFYILPYDNYMSHYECRCKFSAQQLRYMAYMILTRRLYLH